MLSESQERMLLVAEKGREKEVLDVFSKWGLDATIAGQVIAENRMRVWQHGVLVADIPNESLTDDAPLYHRPVGTWKAPVPLDPPAEILAELQKPRDYTADLKKLLAASNICSKRWVFEQYDSMVQTNTVQGPGGEAGVMRIKGSGTPGHERGLAMALAGNSRWCYLDPKLGAMHAVAEAARKVACTGATPVAATNCLNFGNPEKPEIMAQLSAAIDGVGEACTALGTPITGGNVSLYNETRGEGIYPTPVIGIVGLFEDVSKAVASDFKRGQTLMIVGAAIPGSREEIVTSFGSSGYAKTILESLWGAPPKLSVAKEATLHQTLVKLANDGLIEAARDISDGGMAVALAEGCFEHGAGATFNLTIPAEYANALGLFSEGASHVILGVTPAHIAQVKTIVESNNMFVAATAQCEGDVLRINFNGQVAIDASIAELKKSWSSTLESVLTEVHA